MVGGAQCHTLGVVKSVPVEYTETMASQQLQQSTVLQVKDVYDIAQSVGEQFQVLIQHFGISYLGELVNTVVDALEHLETYVQDNQKLQTRVVKVLLDNDNLIKENELLKAESQKNAEILASMETEKQQLVLQLKATTEANRELQKYNEECDHEYSESDQESSKHENGKKHDDENRTNGEASLISVLDGKDDVLELHRIKKRLAQVENELKRTRTKLLSAQATMKCIVTENNSLKTELEDSKAEIGLKALVIGNEEHHTERQKESPKFYKKDLLSVLRERNELKEELDCVRDELNMTRLKLRYQLQQPTDYFENIPIEDSNLERARANTKIREIVTSITTDSIPKKKRK